MLTATAIEGYKHYTEQTIGRAQYRIDGAWYNVAISRKERMPDGRVAVYFPIIPAASTVTISGVRLYDTKGNLWAEKTESIKLASAQEGVLYRFTFDIHEEEG